MKTKISYRAFLATLTLVLFLFPLSSYSDDCVDQEFTLIESEVEIQNAVIYPGLISGIDGTININYDFYEDEFHTLYFKINSITSTPVAIVGAKQVVMKRAIIEILKARVASGDIEDGDCAWFWFTSCWYVKYDLSYVIEGLYPCDGDLCCKVKYCIDIVNNEPIITTQDLYSAADDCYFYDPPLGPELDACEYICDALDFGDDEPDYDIYELPEIGCNSCGFLKEDKCSFTYNSNPIVANYRVYQCSTSIEVEIYSIVSDSSLGNDKGALMKEATRKVLKQAAIDNSGNPDNILLMIQSCWQFIGNGNAMIPCFDDQYHCCRLNYIINENGGSYYVQTASTPIMQPNDRDCDNVTDCDYLCDEDNVWIDTQVAMKKSIPDSKRIQFELFEVKPNPSTGNTEIKLTTEEMGELKLIIYNEIGAEVFSTRFNKTTYEFSGKLDLGKLPSGIYFMGAEINGKSAVKSNLIILK